MRITSRAGHASRNGHQHSGVIEEAKGRFSGLTQEAMSLETEMVEEAKKRGGEMVEGAQEWGQWAWKRTEKWIKKSPGAALGVAFVIGVVFKSWLSRTKE
jgi:ElaB/YqjD/DUF883 family membrane-anchored ribosome-binding protein